MQECFVTGLNSSFGKEKTPYQPIGAYIGLFCDGGRYRI